MINPLFCDRFKQFWMDVEMKRAGLIVISVAFVLIALAVWYFRPKTIDVASSVAVGSLELAGNELQLPPPTVSKAITFATQPIKANGFVDYYATLNQRASEGVTVENNAAVLFFKAGVGVSEMTPERREHYGALLGVDVSELIQPGFQNLQDLSEKESKRIIRATMQPWLAKQFPRFREWVDSNDAALAVVTEGTRRPRCYIPMIPTDDDDSLLSTRLEFHDASRDVARCLAARWMLRIGEGKFAEAAQDLLTCHRLGRLIGESPSLMCGVAGQTLEVFAWYGEVALLERAALSAEDALAFQRELCQLRPLPVLIDKVDFAERLSLLDTVMKKERGVELIAELFDHSTADAGKTDVRAKLAEFSNESLRRCNERIDEFVGAGRIATFAERTAALTALTTELRNAAGRFGDPQTAIGAAVGDWKTKTPTEVGRQAGDVYFTFLLPDVAKAVNDDTRTRMRFDLVQVGFALAAYHADHHEYPGRLEAIVPVYLPEIPPDRYNEQALHYIKEEDGYLLYSVGVNGIDDLGHVFNSQPVGDDVVLKIRPRH